MWCVTKVAHCTLSTTLPKLQRIHYMCAKLVQKVHKIYISNEMLYTFGKFKLKIQFKTIYSFSLN